MANIIDNINVGGTDYAISGRIKLIESVADTNTHVNIIPMRTQLKENTLYLIDLKFKRSDYDIEWSGPFDESYLFHFKTHNIFTNADGVRAIKHSRAQTAEAIYNSDTDKNEIAIMQVVYYVEDLLTDTINGIWISMQNEDNTKEIWDYYASVSFNIYEIAVGE
jgi:hypothetical protein